MEKYISDALISARKARGLTQKEVATLLGGIVPTTISGYETGFSEPNIDTLMRLCQIYQIDIGELLRKDCESQELPDEKYSVSAILKQLRSDAGYTATEVAHKLKSYSHEISAKTLYGYESGLSMPNADIFLALCKIYECNDPMDLSGKKRIKPSEMELLRKYRSLGTHEQTVINTILDLEYNKKEEV